jgi:ABC-2 type transport system ATP-binding protein
MWDIITGLVKEGTTVLLTTQYLEEADRLADTIAVLDRGRIIKEGSSFELKGCCGGDAFIQVRVADRSRTEAAAALLGDLGDGRMTVSPELGDVSLAVTEGAALLPEIVRRLDGGGIAIADISLRQPTLDDVFLALTGHSTEQVAEDRTQAEGGVPAGREGGTA